MEQEQGTTEYALSLIAAGDGAGCDLLYAQLGGAMLAAARAVTGDRAAAEDAVQDAFIRIVRGIHGYRPGTNPRAWVLRIVRNCAIAKIDRHKAANIDEFYNLADGQDCEERACDRLLAESLLQSLTSAQRKVIYLKYFFRYDRARDRQRGRQVEVVCTERDRPFGTKNAANAANPWTKRRRRRLIYCNEKPRGRI